VAAARIPRTGVEMARIRRQAAEAVRAAVVVVASIRRPVVMGAKEEACSRHWTEAAEPAPPASLEEAETGARCLRPTAGAVARPAFASSYVAAGVVALPTSKLRMIQASMASA
jgi:hypothetical protein